MEKGCVVICVDNSIYERELLKGNKYNVYNVKEEKDKTLIDIGASRFYPSELFIEENKYKEKILNNIVSEERNIIDDVAIINDVQDSELISYREKISYILYYWHKQVSELDENIKNKKLHYAVWIAETRKELLDSIGEGLEQKEKDKLLKNYSTQTSQEELIILKRKELYIAKNSEINKLEKDREIIKGALRAIETKSFQLMSIANSFSKEYNVTR